MTVFPRSNYIDLAMAKSDNDDDNGNDVSIVPLHSTDLHVNHRYATS